MIGIKSISMGSDLENMVTIPYDESNVAPDSNRPKIKVTLNEYTYNCSDGCCTNFGTKTTVNGIELSNHNQDTETITLQILDHLGYDADVERIYSGDC